MSLFLGSLGNRMESLLGRTQNREHTLSALLAGCSRVDPVSSTVRDAFALLRDDMIVLRGKRDGTRACLNLRRLVV